ncbi:MAG: 2-amino-4-hydroxy-6-hydroxymethyldihydropteridine diphosphokinase [Muribaculaceae bacterium]|nr:2-amino-4-hydroxy-6-hydroxymethyldihydropteridine diphosphokinase [Muribaculaceae bacterium]
MTSTVYLNIGSNSGDRRAFIARAVAALRSSALFAGAQCRLSEAVESEPWGFESEHGFTNIGLAFDIERAEAWTDAELEALLDTTQAVERSLSAMPHRNADGSYRDREIDIDIIEVDDIVYSSPRLTLPHPHASERPFVSGPLEELKSKPCRDAGS